MKCRQISEMLPGYRSDDFPQGVRRHLARCADCRAEVARYRQIDLSLAELGAGGIEPPPGLRAALVAIPHKASRLADVRSHVSRNKRTYTGVAVAAVGAAGAALWRSRRRIATA